MQKYKKFYQSEDDTGMKAQLFNKNPYNNIFQKYLMGHPYPKGKDKRLSQQLQPNQTFYDPYNKMKPKMVYVDKEGQEIDPQRLKDLTDKYNKEEGDDRYKRRRKRSFDQFDPN